MSGFSVILGQLFGYKEVFECRLDVEFNPPPRTSFAAMVHHPVKRADRNIILKAREGSEDYHHYGEWVIAKVDCDTPKILASLIPASSEDVVKALENEYNRKECVDVGGDNNYRYSVIRVLKEYFPEHPLAAEETRVAPVLEFRSYLTEDNTVYRRVIIAHEDGTFSLLKIDNEEVESEESKDPGEVCQTLAFALSDKDRIDRFRENFGAEFGGYDFYRKSIDLFIEAYLSQEWDAYTERCEERARKLFGFE